ncbi:MAG: putative toxin-antitoxin system toxin component, PIN family [Actinomycetales bacterium]|nr:putative toxin-antitoxin system toxin component, PIN family [Actinomycetales bacterium]
MRRVVLDVNVYVAALLSPAGTPAQVLLAWTNEEYELIVSPQLLAELERVLRRPKFSRSISDPEITALLDGLREDATVLPDPPAEPGLTPDPKDDYLVTLARAAHADCIVSGDTHLTGLEDPKPPVLTPTIFLASCA